ncbi:gpi anchored [Fusarium longipes]|uniref:Gpi anchored n=1 Tax=Fusarium longipes TaxID=694270 RepID=A0A395S7M9_9HYPO|nr:gpi anchored [Fusarium longipes]
MRLISTVLLSLAALLPRQTAAESSSPTAIKKLAPGSNEKLLREHLAFDPLQVLSPRDAAAAALSFLDEQDEELLKLNGTQRFYRPAFAPHSEESRDGMLRRAAEALALLQRRSSCPKGMNICSNIDPEVKCCQEGTYCVDVGDSVVGGVACCPDGASCDGGVGSCPSDAASCPEELGGGCCIPGYVCQGLGCVPSSVATPTSTAQAPITTTQEITEEPTVGPTTETEAETTTEEEPTTVSEAETETELGSETQGTATASTTATGSVTGIAPYRPTGTSVTTSSEDEETQTGCPTGFYGCLATHGGGCCRTDRNCDTHDCPAPSTTIVTDGATVVVLATDAPPAPGPSSTCAGGWFLCGTDAGPVPGCCPDGYECGTASCFTAIASETARLQKEFPEAATAGHEKPAVMMAMAAMVFVYLALA